MDVLYGILIPFVGTTLGAAMVFLMKSKINKKIEQLLLGFAAGVMIAASVWSLIIPAIEMARNQNVIAWLPATIGFLLGIFFLLFLEKVISHLKNNTIYSEGMKEKIKKTSMMILTVTLHNIPEGMAVGVALAGAICQNAGITMAGALALAVGIGIQNFPEGAIISMPLKSQGIPKLKAFLAGVLSRNTRANCSNYNHIAYKFSSTNFALLFIICSWLYAVCCSRRVNSRIKRRQF